MESTKTGDRCGDSLILSTRQLEAALRKSAQRARRLAEAFGKTVPAARPATPTKPAAAAKPSTTAAAGKRARKPPK